MCVYYIHHLLSHCVTEHCIQPNPFYNTFSLTMLDQALMQVNQQLQGMETHEGFHQAVRLGSEIWTVWSQFGFQIQFLCLCVWKMKSKKLCGMEWHVYTIVSVQCAVLVSCFCVLCLALNFAFVFFFCLSLWQCCVTFDHRGICWDSKMLVLSVGCLVRSLQSWSTETMSPSNMHPANGSQMRWYKRVLLCLCPLKDAMSNNQVLGGRWHGLWRTTLSLFFGRI